MIPKVGYNRFYLLLARTSISPMGRLAQNKAFSSSFSYAGINNISHTHPESVDQVLTRQASHFNSRTNWETWIEDILNLQEKSILRTLRLSSCLRTFYIPENNKYSLYAPFSFQVACIIGNFWSPLTFFPLGQIVSCVEACIVSSVLIHLPFPFFCPCRTQPPSLQTRHCLALPTVQQSPS